MKILFVYPRFEKFLESTPDLAEALHDFGVGAFRTPPSLALPLLAASTPPQHDVSLVDANMEPVDFDQDVDLVAISFFTPQADSARAIADGFRARGRLVVVGGMHPTASPDACAEHVDAVVVGEGEPVWPQLLADAEAGALRPRYVAPPMQDLAAVPRPRFEIFSRAGEYEWQSGLVQVSRGCPLRCQACSIPGTMGRRLRYRPVDAVVAEVEALPFDSYYLADDTVMLPTRANVAYSRELFTALRGSRRTCFATTTMSLNTDPDLLRTLYDGGVRTLYTVAGFDPVSVRALRPDATHQAWQKAVDALHAIGDAGIAVFGSFGLGHDEHDPGIFDRVLRLCRDGDVQLSEFFLATPYPGTPLWDRVRAQGRLLDRPWSEFNGAHVVHRPGGMTAEELQRGYHRIWRDFYADKEPARSLDPMDLHATPADWRRAGHSFPVKGPQGR